MSGAKAHPMAYRTARSWRRMFASAVDILLVLSIAGLPYLTGVINWRVYQPPDGVFFADHLLSLVATSSGIIHPVVLGLSVWILWHFTWIYFGGGRTLGMWAAKIGIVNQHGESPDLTVAGLRVLGHFLSAACLGLGWLWIFVSAHRRSWPDLISHTWIVTSPPNRSGE